MQAPHQNYNRISVLEYISSYHATISFILDSYCSFSVARLWNRMSDLTPERVKVHFLAKLVKFHLLNLSFRLYVAMALHFLSTILSIIYFTHPMNEIPFKWNYFDLHLFKVSKDNYRYFHTFKYISSNLLIQFDIIQARNSISSTSIIKKHAHVLRLKQ